MSKWERSVDIATFTAAICAVLLCGAIGWRVLTDSPQVLTSPDRIVPEWRELAEGGNWMGPRDAPVVIIEFGDYECPACRAVAPHIEAVRSRFPEDVALVYRHWPLSYHPLAHPAARAAECAAGQGKFEEFHTWLYRDVEWMANPRGRFTRIAAEIGIPDSIGFETCVDDLAPVAEIERDVKAVKELGGTGTPTILVNDILLGSVADSLTLIDLVEAALDSGS